MLVWGGRADGTGGIYDSVSDRWQRTTEDGAPLSRRRATAFWIGDRMLVWGGTTDDPTTLPYSLVDGAVFTP